MELNNGTQVNIDILIQQIDQLHIIIKEYRADNDEICKNLDWVMKDTKKLQKENNILKKQNSQLEKEIEYLQKEYFNIVSSCQGSWVKILKISIPS